MSRIRICDVCGNPTGTRYFKARMKKVVIFPMDVAKYPIDVCDSCWEKLKDFVAAKGGDDE